MRILIFLSIFIFVFCSLSMAQEIEEPELRYYLKDGQEDLPEQEKIIIIEKVVIETEEMTINEMLIGLEYAKQQMIYYITLYNYLIDKIIEIHENPELPGVEDMPMKIQYNWYYPIAY